jgi:hypothetical protein
MQSREGPLGLTHLLQRQRLVEQNSSFRLRRGERQGLGVQFQGTAKLTLSATPGGLAVGQAPCSEEPWVGGGSGFPKLPRLGEALRC